MADDNTSPDVESALSNLSEQDDQAGFLRTLAAGEVLLPQMEPVDPEEGMKLPYIEQEDTRYVLVFSTEDRLNESGIEVHDTVTLSGGQLGAAWPDEEELWLAINPGSEQSVAVPPDAVRALPSMIAAES